MLVWWMFYQATGVALPGVEHGGGANAPTIPWLDMGVLQSAQLWPGALAGLALLWAAAWVRRTHSQCL